MGVLPEIGLVKHLDQSEHINEKKHKLERDSYPNFREYMKKLKLPALVVPNRFSDVVSGIADQKLRKEVQPIDPVAFVQILDHRAKEMYKKGHHDRRPDLSIHDRDFQIRQVLPRVLGRMEILP
jgi:hypothetical protein